jgi:hypothetical protein
VFIYEVTKHTPEEGSEVLMLTSDSEKAITTAKAMVKTYGYRVTIQKWNATTGQICFDYGKTLWPNMGEVIIEDN